MNALPLFALFFFCLSTAQAQVRYQIEASYGYDVIIENEADGEVSILTSGEDPQVIISSEKSSPRIHPRETVLSFEYFCPDGVDFVELFYTNDLSDPDWSQQRQVEGDALPKAETWQPYTINLSVGSKGKWDREQNVFRLDFGRKEGLRMQVRNFTLRAPTAAELVSAEAAEAIVAAKVETADAIDALLYKEDWPASINAIKVLEETIEISAELEQTTQGDVGLLSLEAHEAIWDTTAGSFIQKARFDDTKVHFSIPRFSEIGRDRLTNRFAIISLSESGHQLQSYPKWADSVLAERSMPRLRPSNLKGLGGLEYKEGIFDDDLDTLGVTAGTVNIDLGGLIADASSANTIEYKHQNKTWYFHAGSVERFDDLLKKLSDKDIVMSAILLISKNSGSLVHPEYKTAGIYSMANLSDQASSDLFRATVSFLAERYSRPDKKYGWISHWIIFNEVDFGWVWTNMGEQPMSVYMDTYERAMRLVWLETRRFNPTAEVFVSLTHHWDYSPSDSLRTYPPREILDRLALYSEKAGDYGWAIAYHPYPQSLLRPRTWEDSSTTNSFDSPYITPKNIEVLDAYLHQPQFLHDGAVRTVILSEQGYHTPDYSESSMLDKAAAIAYTWAKITELESVESFHYHRWVDHPKEGGLKVGLRTLPSPDKPFGERKEPAFTLFSKLETPQQEAEAAPLKAIIGIEYWSDILVQASEITKDTVEE